MIKICELRVTDFEDKHWVLVPLLTLLLGAGEGEGIVTKEKEGWLGKTVRRTKQHQKLAKTQGN